MGRGNKISLEKNYRINTTISSRHNELLLKYSETFGTKQKALENALESLENKLKNKETELSIEEEAWMRICHEDLVRFHLLIPRGLVRVLLKTSNIEELRYYVENFKQTEAVLEWYYEKPFEKLTLKELINGITLRTKLISFADTVDFTENKYHYIINITHNLGIFQSQLYIIVNESVFRSYGLKFESHFSERSIHFKIYKKE